MTKRSKAILMNVAVLVTLTCFYFKGTQPLVLLISGILCLVLLNVVMGFSKGRP